MGCANFIEHYNLWNQEQQDAALEVVGKAKEKKLEVIRLSFADQHGILRGKTIFVDVLESVMHNGCSIPIGLLVKDTSHRAVYPVFAAGAGMSMQEMAGGGNFLIVPDPTTFCSLPWAPETGWMLCDMFFSNGTPVPFSTRQLLKQTLGKLADEGFDYVAGLEVEFNIFKLEDPHLKPEQSGQPAMAPEVSLLAHGYQVYTEIRMDELDPVLGIIRKNLKKIGLLPRTMEVEFGPGQCEITFPPAMGLKAADSMVIFRNVVKQICRRHGYHATFMCRPKLPNMFANGWHLHQTLYDRRTEKNVFVPDENEKVLSATGRYFVAGLLEHACASSLFSTPTINGYKRYAPYSLAPDRANWGFDNRGVMIRVIGGNGDPGTRIENRVGEPAANPYLYMASQIVAGMDGVRKQSVPPPTSNTPYEDEVQKLPRSLMEAISALRGSELFRQDFGQRFVDYILTVKEFEVSRFLSHVTDWEQQEYFELF